jgi:predicted secreted protein
MTTSPEPAPAVVTQADDGRLISLTVGAELPLRLDSSWAWDQPAVDGPTVALTQVDYFADPGFMEWIVMAAQPGDAVVTATGMPNCGDDSECPPIEVRISFRVTG